MANLQQILDGINIIRRYYNNPIGYQLSANNGELYMDSTDTPISDDDLLIVEHIRMESNIL